MAKKSEKQEVIDTYNEKKRAALKKMCGEELNLSTYLHLKELEVKDCIIYDMYGYSRAMFYAWKSAHQKLLDERGIKNEASC